MRVHEIQAKSVLIKRKHIDSWFVSLYGMNLYRGCQHNCAYCDGRAEGYYVEGEFGRDIWVKINAPEILRRELDPARRRKPLKGGYFFLGGGVGDSYQPLEETYDLSEEQKYCKICGLPRKRLSAPDESELFEIEVKAHKRVIRKWKYVSGCNCRESAGIVTAEGPLNLIPQS